MSDRKRPSHWYEDVSKKWLFTAAALVGIMLAMIYITTATPPPPVAQPVARPAIVPYTSYIGASGITEPNTENIAIGTSVPGIVSAIYVSKGDMVKKGDSLFLIEDREAKANLAQADANVDEAIAELHNARDQYAIVTRITDKRAVSQDESNQKRHAVEIAEAKVRTTKAAADSLSTELALHTVRAPFDGTVMTANIRLGEFASTGNLSDPLIRFGNLNPMHVRIDIDENDAWRFRPNASATAFVRGNPQIKIPLEFVRIEPYVRPKISLTGQAIERVDTRVLQVIYHFDPTHYPIYAGQQVDVYIEAPEPPGVKHEGARHAS